MFNVEAMLKHQSVIKRQRPLSKTCRCPYFLNQATRFFLKPQHIDCFPMVSRWFPMIRKDWILPMVSLDKIPVFEVRSFEDCAAGVWDGTGFVVSLDNPKAGPWISWISGLGWTMMLGSCWLFKMYPMMRHGDPWWSCFGEFFCTLWMLVNATHFYQMPQVCLVSLAFCWYYSQF